MPLGSSRAGRRGSAPVGVMVGVGLGSNGSLDLRATDGTSLAGCEAGNETRGCGGSPMASSPSTNTQSCASDTQGGECLLHCVSTMHCDKARSLFCAFWSTGCPLLLRHALFLSKNLLLHVISTPSLTLQSPPMTHAAVGCETPMRAYRRSVVAMVSILTRVYFFLVAELQTEVGE